VDLHLGSEFRVFRKAREVIRVTEETDYETVTEKVHAADGLMLVPGETVLGITREQITLAPHLCGWLEGRSRFARLGLLVHVSASFMQPGIANKQCLELSNFSPMPLLVAPGLSAGLVLFLFKFADIVDVSDMVHVVHRLLERWDTTERPHGILAGVICCEGQGDIPAKCCE
jgi:deoxycytidine triphosphate deaminase